MDFVKNCATHDPCYKHRTRRLHFEVSKMMLGIMGFHNEVASILFNEGETMNKQAYRRLLMLREAMEDMVRASPAYTMIEPATPTTDKKDRKHCHNTPKHLNFTKRFNFTAAYFNQAWREDNKYVKCLAETYLSEENKCTSSVCEAKVITDAVNEIITSIEVQELHLHSTLGQSQEKIQAEINKMDNSSADKCVLDQTPTAKRNVTPKMRKISNDTSTRKDPNTVTLTENDVTSETEERANTNLRASPRKRRKVCKRNSEDNKLANKGWTDTETEDEIDCEMFDTTDSDYNPSSETTSPGSVVTPETSQEETINKDSTILQEKDMKKPKSSPTTIIELCEKAPSKTHIRPKRQEGTTINHEVMNKTSWMESTRHGLTKQKNSAKGGSQPDSRAIEITEMQTAVETETTESGPKHEEVLRLSGPQVQLKEAILSLLEQTTANEKTAEQKRLTAMRDPRLTATSQENVKQAEAKKTKLDTRTTNQIEQMISKARATPSGGYRLAICTLCRYAGMAAHKNYHRHVKRCHSPKSPDEIIRIIEVSKGEAFNLLAKWKPIADRNVAQKLS